MHVQSTPGPQTASGDFHFLRLRLRGIGASSFRGPAGAERSSASTSLSRILVPCPLQGSSVGVVPNILLHRRQAAADSDTSGPSCTPWCCRRQEREDAPASAYHRRPPRREWIAHEVTDLIAEVLIRGYGQDALGLSGAGFAPRELSRSPSPHANPVGKQLHVGHPGARNWRRTRVPLPASKEPGSRYPSPAARRTHLPWQTRPFSNVRYDRVLEMLAHGPGLPAPGS